MPLKLVYASSYVPHPRLTRNRIRYIRHLIITANAPHALAHTLKVNERLEVLKKAAPPHMRPHTLPHALPHTHTLQVNERLEALKKAAEGYKGSDVEDLADGLQV